MKRKLQVCRRCFFRLPCSLRRQRWRNSHRNNPLPATRRPASETAAEGDAKAAGQPAVPTSEGLEADDNRLSESSSVVGSRLPQSHRHGRARAHLRPGVLPEVRADVGRQLAEARSRRRRSAATSANMTRPHFAALAQVSPKFSSTAGQFRAAATTEAFSSTVSPPKSSTASRSFARRPPTWTARASAARSI